MNTKQTLFGLGMLVVGAGVATLTLPISDASISGITSSISSLTAPFSEKKLTFTYKKLTEEEKAEHLAQMTQKLETDLAEGTITQEQYDEMKTQLENREPIMSGFKRGHGEIKELTEEEKAKIQAQHKERLVQELAAGKITKEQYDEMLTNLENFTFPMMKASFHFGGLSGEQVQWTGEMGEAMNFTMQRVELTEKEKAEFEAHRAERMKMIETALADGEITQEQYDEIQTRMANDEPVKMRFGMASESITTN